MKTRLEILTLAALPPSLAESLRLSGQPLKIFDGEAKPRRHCLHIASRLMSSNSNGKPEAFRKGERQSRKRVAVKFLLSVILVLAQVSCASVSLAPADAVADKLGLTSADGALPGDAYKARLSLAYGAPGKMVVGQRRAIHLLVKNTKASA